MRSLARFFFAVVFFSFGSASLSAPRTNDNAPWNINFNETNNPAEYYGKWDNHNYFPSPKDWRDVGIYQFVTDRLRDGDPTNNELKYDGYNVYDVGSRHGGDFRGVKESLSYIKSLGYDAIWISPIFQNRFNSYHGYAQIDFTLLDARFGTLEDFRQMVDRAHELGMYVIVDIVINHMDNLFYFEGHKNDGAPFRMHQGEYQVFPRVEGETYADFFVNNTFNPNGSYPDVYGYDGFLRRDDFGSGSFWDSDFHHNGDLNNYDDVWQNHLGKIYGIMDDLRTGHPRVQDKIIAMSKALISSTDIDGMRIDTPMQVPLSFFKRWVPAVKDHAENLGKDNFFIFGEFYCPRARSATMVGRGKTPDHYSNPNAHIDDTFTMDGGINYDLYFNFMGPAIKEQKNHLGEAFRHFQQDLKSYDFFNPARGVDIYSMLNFYNNHDQWRLNWENDGFKKSLLASAVIAFWPGIPLFYYGDEQGFATEGTALDGKSREDFMTSKAWFDQRSRSDQNPAIFDNFNMTHPMYLEIQKIMNVRKQYYSLRNTHEIYERWVQKDETNGIYAFSRAWGDKKNWAFVAFNTWRDRLEAGGAQGKLHTGWNEGEKIVNALNPSETYTLGVGGIINSLWLDPYETKVFVREDNLQPLNPVIQSITPQHDAVLASDQTEITLTFSEPMDRTSLEQTISFDNATIQASDFNIDSNNKKVTFSVNANEGLHKIQVKAKARAQNGKALFADFTSRFRVGSTNNPLITLQKAPLKDQTLFSVEGLASGQFAVTINHKAPGAQKFRVSWDKGSTWSEWRNYEDRSSIEITAQEKQSAEAGAQVHYWTDGSSAYFVEGKL